MSATLPKRPQLDKFRCETCGESVWLPRVAGWQDQRCATCKGEDMDYLDDLLAGPAPAPVGPMKTLWGDARELQESDEDVPF